MAWVNNTFRATTSFEDSYRNPAIARVAARFIDEWKPDVAHVHHLTCLSTEIVDVLATRRIPVVYTLHDYWLLCHRGQRLDTSYQVCDGPGPSGCGGCVHAGAEAPVPGAMLPVLRAVEGRLPKAIGDAGRQIVAAALAGRPRLTPTRPAPCAHGTCAACWSGSIASWRRRTRCATGSSVRACRPAASGSRRTAWTTNRCDA